MVDFWNRNLKKKFLKQEPEQVIKTIYAHWVETNETSAKDTMKGELKGTAGEESEERLDMTKYGATEKNGEPDKKGMVNYYWDKAKGSALTFYKVKEEKKKDDEEKTPEENKSWFKFSKDNILRPCVTYIGGTLVIAGILVAVFWDKVTGWWNGPADEQGENKTEGDEKEEEEE